MSILFLLQKNNFFFLKQKHKYNKEQPLISGLGLSVRGHEKSGCGPGPFNTWAKTLGPCADQGLKS